MKNRYVVIANICRALILLGIALAIYIYLFNFRYLSEDDLIFWTPFWFFPIIIGYYGVTASKILARKHETRFEKAVSGIVFDVMKESAGGWAIPFILILNLPFLITKSKSVLFTAFVGAIIWAIALFIFFKYIFPYL
jgi:hypothetical protein